MTMQQGETSVHISAGAARLGAAASHENGAVRQEALSFRLHDLTMLTVRLAHVLAEEVDCLEEMRVKDVEKLQEEKSRLTRTIAAMKKEMERVPGFHKQFPQEEREEFRRVAEVFAEVLEENRSKLLVAKEINAQVVRAISEVVREESLRDGYNRKGRKGTSRDAAPSITLNKTI